MQLAHNWLTRHALQEVLDVNQFGYDWKDRARDPLKRGRQRWASVLILLTD